MSRTNLIFDLSKLVNNQVNTVKEDPVIKQDLEQLLEQVLLLSNLMVQDCYEDQDVNFNVAQNDSKYNLFTDRILEKLNDIMENYVKE